MKSKTQFGDNNVHNILRRFDTVEQIFLSPQLK